MSNKKKQFDQTAKRLSFAREIEFQLIQNIKIFCHEEKNVHYSHLLLTRCILAGDIRDDVSMRKLQEKVVRVKIN